MQLAIGMCSASTCQLRQLVSRLTFLNKLAVPSHRVFGVPVQNVGALKTPSINSTVNLKTFEKANSRRGGLQGSPNCGSATARLHTVDMTIAIAAAMTEIRENTNDERAPLSVVPVVPMLLGQMQMRNQTSKSRLRALSNEYRRISDSPIYR